MLNDLALAHLEAWAPTESPTEPKATKEEQKLDKLDRYTKVASALGNSGLDHSDGWRSRHQREPPDDVWCALDSFKYAM